MGGSGEVLDKPGAGDFGATSLSACGLSALCAALPCGLVEDGLVGLFEGTFRRAGALLALHVMTEMHFLLQRKPIKMSCMVMSE